MPACEGARHDIGMRNMTLQSLAGSNDSKPFLSLHFSLTSEPRGWEHATMPLVPRTGDLRLLKSMMWKGSLVALGAIAAHEGC